MDAHKLADALLRPGALPLRSNHFAITWQVSHVACATADRGVTSSFETFLAGLLWNGVGGYTAHISDPRPWLQRVDFVAWAHELTVEPLQTARWTNLIMQAEKELRDADEPTSMSVAWLADVHAEAGWQIKETVQERHPVGLTEAYLVRTSAFWIFLESHWES